MKTSTVGAELFHGNGQTDGGTDGQTEGRLDGQTDGRTNRQKAGRHDAANSRFSKIYERT
jgi:hypothetical protein